MGMYKASSLRADHPSKDIPVMSTNATPQDALELSDDSDIEVHPNVDKRSFIRAKQSQIHQQRLERRHRITTLKYEKVVNDGLLARIDALLKALETHRSEVAERKEAGDVDEVVFDCLMEVSSDGSLGDDNPPSPPEGVHTQEGETPSYSKMMGALVDQVKAEVDKQKAAEGLQRYEAYVKEVGGHKTKVAGLQKDLLAELNKLEKEEGSRITSESIHTGFDSSHVAKSTPATSAVPAKTGKKAEPELLNPNRPTPAAGDETPGSEADIEEGMVEGEDDEMQASPLAKEFSKIPFGDYHASLAFISQHPSVLAEKETDGLLVEAFTAQQNAKSKKEEEYARQCVHQALLLQYCRQLGKDGVGLFFKRIQTPGHQARKLFLDDVHSTYARIKERTAELNKMKDGEDGDREQIQLHAVDPNTTINIVTPPPADQCTTDDEKAAREIFDTFPPGLQRALESGSLDRVNEVLGRMAVDEAEQVVALLGKGGMLSLEEGVIDATTEEGRKKVEELEREGKEKGKQAVQEIGEPGPAVQEIVEEEGKLAVDEVD
jgi:cell division cycle protein 37